MISSEVGRNPTQLENQGYKFDRRNNLWYKPIIKDREAKLPEFGVANYSRCKRQFLVDGKDSVQALFEAYERSNQFLFQRQIKPYPFITGNRYQSEVAINIGRMTNDNAEDFNVEFNPAINNLPPEINVFSSNVGSASYLMDGSLAAIILFLGDDKFFVCDVTNREVTDENGCYLDELDFLLQGNAFPYNGSLFTAKMNEDTLRVVKNDPFGVCEICSVSARTKTDRMKEAVNVIYGGTYDMNYEWIWVKHFFPVNFGQVVAL